MPTQKRPPGPMWVIDDDWKRRTREAMKERGISMSQLAKIVGSSQPAISIVFAPQTIQSRLVPAIHKALGLEPPSSTSADEARAFVLSKWKDLTDEDRETVRRLIDALTAKK